MILSCFEVDKWFIKFFNGVFEVFSCNNSLKNRFLRFKKLDLDFSVIGGDQKNVLGSDRLPTATNNLLLA